MFKNRYKRFGCLLLFIFLIGKAMAQQPLTFELERVNDSLSWLCLYPKVQVNTEQKGHKNKRKARKAIAKWKLPYPVYQLATGDINGDGKDEAIVGVIKPTVVADYVWDDFGLSFVRFLIEAVSHEEAVKRFVASE